MHKTLFEQYVDDHPYGELFIEILKQHHGCSVDEWTSEGVPVLWFVRMVYGHSGNQIRGILIRAHKEWAGVLKMATMITDDDGWKLVNS